MRRWRNGGTTGVLAGAWLGGVGGLAGEDGEGDACVSRHKIECYGMFAGAGEGAGPCVGNECVIWNYYKHPRGSGRAMGVAMA
jgi:hypothetical protein